MNVRRRCQAVLGVAAVDGRADDGEVAVQIAATRQPRALGHLRQRGIDHHAVADVRTFHVVSDRDDFAGDIHARDVREGEARHREPAVALDHIEVVERGEHHPDDDVLRTGVGIGHVGVLEHLGPSGFSVQDRFHEWSPLDAATSAT